MDKFAYFSIKTCDNSLTILTSTNNWCSDAFTTIYHHKISLLLLDWFISQCSSQSNYLFYNSLGAVVQCNRRDNSVFNNWQLAQHAAKIIGDIIASGRVLEIWQPLCVTSQDRGPRQGNKAEKTKQKKNWKLYLHAGLWGIGGWEWCGGGGGAWAWMPTC